MEEKEMPEKDWRKEMGKKFTEWRERNEYSGLISVPEVAHFTQDVISETKDLIKIADTRNQIKVVEEE